MVKKATNSYKSGYNMAIANSMATPFFTDKNINGIDFPKIIIIMMKIAGDSYTH